MRGVIASGSKLNSEAGAAMLKQGGNAFDACLAAAFASFVTEPMLISAAGGGMGILQSKGRARCIDMGTNYPGLERTTKEKPIKSIVNFGEEKQVFCLGYPSIGVGGVLQGLMYIFEKYATLPMHKIVEPAKKYAGKGIKLTKMQAYINYILRDMCTYTPKAREIFMRNKALLGEGETIYNREFARFLEELGKDREKAMEGYNKQSAETVKGKPCSLGKRDMEEYKVKERDALKISYHGHDICTATPPSSGGVLLGHSLKQLSKIPRKGISHNDTAHIEAIVKAMRSADAQQTGKFFQQLICESGFGDSFLGNTTHMGVIDEEENVLGITASNGQGAGIMVGNTGIMYNNFLGEDDLMKHAEIYKPGHRMTTMVSPTLITKKGKVRAVLGTGGSKRIRSAMLQAIVNFLDFDLPPQQAVNEARVHYDDTGVLQLEAGIKKEVAYQLEKKFKIHRWKIKNLYFGGVHMATPHGGGGGDQRREGYVIEVD